MVRGAPAGRACTQWCTVHCALALLTLLIFIGCTSSLSCVCGEKESCSPLGDCPYGSGMDPCGCCPACMLGLGDKCGGPFDVYGVCGAGLYCHTRAKHYGYRQLVNQEGVCTGEGTPVF